MTVIVVVAQSGPNVVATATGSVDLTDLTYIGTQPIHYDFGHAIGPDRFVIGSGLADDVYSHVNGPSFFGYGPGVIATSNSGDVLAVGSGDLGVSWGYVSGAPISGSGLLSSIYENETIFSLGLIPGTYLYTWGTGAHADSLALRIGDSVATPEPATWMLLLLGFVVLGRAVSNGQNKRVTQE